MDNSGVSGVAILFLGVFALSVILIVWMFVSLVRSELGDERRQLIVGKASFWAFIAMVGSFLIETFEVAIQQPNGEPTSPFIRLVVAALMYAVFLGWFKRKYGG